MSGSCDGANHSLGVYRTDAVIISVSDVQDAVFIHRYAGGSCDTGAISGAVITHEKEATISGNGMDDSLGIDSPHPVVPAVGDIKIAFFIQSQSERFRQLCLGGRA